MEKRPGFEVSLEKVGELINKVSASKCTIISKPARAERPERKPYPDIKINRPFEALRGVKIR